MNITTVKRFYLTDTNKQTAAKTSSPPPRGLLDAFAMTFAKLWHQVIYEYFMFSYKKGIMDGESG